MVPVTWLPPTSTTVCAHYIAHAVKVHLLLMRDP